MYLAAKHKPQAKFLIFCGKISPIRAKGTGPTPIPYPNPTNMIHVGITYCVNAVIISSSGSKSRKTLTQVPMPMLTNFPPQSDPPPNSCKPENKNQILSPAFNFVVYRKYNR